MYWQLSKIQNELKKHTNWKLQQHERLFYYTVYAGICFEGVDKKLRYSEMCVTVASTYSGSSANYLLQLCFHFIKDVIVKWKNFPNLFPYLLSIN